MPLDSNELAIILTARLDQLDKGLADATTKIDKYANTTAEANKKAEQSFGAAALAVAALGAGLTAFVVKAAQVAARSETLNIVLANMARQTGRSKVEVDSYVEKIRKLGITTLESQGAVLKFMQANLDLNDALKLARVAQDLAVISGQNSSQAFNLMTTAIVTQRTELLMNFGIMEGVEKIFKRYGETIGKTIKQLTEADKRQAIINRLLEAGATSAGNYERAMDTASKKLASMNRLIEDNMKIIGDAFLPIYNRAVGVAYDLLNAFAKMDPAIQRLTAVLTGATAALVGMLIVFGTLAIKGPVIVGLFKSLMKAIAASPILAAAAALGVLMVAMESFFSVWEGRIKEMDRKNTEMLRSLRESPMTIGQVEALPISERGAAAAQQIKYRQTQIGVLEQEPEKVIGGKTGRRRAEIMRQEVIELEKIQKKYEKTQEKSVERMTEAEIKAAEKRKKIHESAMLSFQTATANAFTAQIDLWNLHAFRMKEIWRNMVNTMVNDFIASGIMDLLGMVIGGPTGALGGSFIGNVLGFDNPADDARMRAMGAGKWYADAAHNFSKGYVNAALTDNRGQAAMLPASAPQGSTVNVTYAPQYSIASPAEARKFGLSIGNVLRRQGVRI